jgi:hypothetical protein
MRGSTAATIFTGGVFRPAQMNFIKQGEFRASRWLFEDMAAFPSPAFSTAQARQRDSRQESAAFRTEQGRGSSILDDRFQRIFDRL